MFGRSPWDELEVLRRELDRLLRSQLERPTAPFSVAFLPGRSARAYPLTNVSEDAENVYVQALAPGLDPEKLELTVLGNTLTIAGEKPAPEGVSAETRSTETSGVQGALCEPWTCLLRWTASGLRPATRMDC